MPSLQEEYFYTPITLFILQLRFLYSKYAILHSNYNIILDVDFINNIDIVWSSRWLQAIILGVNEF